MLRRRTKYQISILLSSSFLIVGFQNCKQSNLEVDSSATLGLTSPDQLPVGRAPASDPSVPAVTPATPAASGMCSSIKATFKGFTAGSYPNFVDVSGNISFTENSVQYSVNVNGDVEYFFQDARPCGQFVNGDWWVQGPVTVTRMTPDFADGKNGFEIDPVVNVQRLDQRIDKYQAPNLTLPLSLSADTKPISLLKAVSFVVIGKDSATDTSCYATLPVSQTNRSSTSNDRACLNSVSVLTVVKDIPASDALRPPYMAGNKPMVRVSDFNFDLGRIQATGVTPVAFGSQVSLDSVLDYFGGASIDHITNWTARFLHPRANMHGGHPFAASSYGADLANHYNTAMMRALDYQSGDNEETRKKLVIQITQTGIDLYSMLVGGQKWFANGGHELGRKVPILFAGKVLKNTSLGQSMLNIGVDYFDYGSTLPSGQKEDRYFSEDDHIYYGVGGQVLFGGTQGGSGTGGTYGGSSSYFLNLNSCRNGRDARDPDGLRDGGAIGLSATGYTTFTALFGTNGTALAGDPAPIVVYYPSNCYGSPYRAQIPTLKQQLAAGVSYASDYQDCCTSRQYVYEAFLIRKMGLVSAWNNNAFFEYADRWLSLPWNNRGYYNSAYLDNVVAYIVAH